MNYENKNKIVLLQKVFNSPAPNKAERDENQMGSIFPCKKQIVLISGKSDWLCKRQNLNPCLIL